MCTYIQPRGPADTPGVLHLCSGDRVAHILGQLGFANRARSEVAKAVLDALSVEAKTVVFEPYYFDIDYRSEIELLQATQFTLIEPTVDRLHFFSMPFARGESVHRFLLDAQKSALEQHKKGREGDLVEAPTYLGYTTIRPRLESRIGRSLISPWAPVKFRGPKDYDEHPVSHTFDYSEGERLDAETVYGQVRTAVPESVNIFGIDFRAVGVPFMEQDGALLRCAHVSAWICHYNAVLRGLVARRTTGQIHRAGHTVDAVARPYPSTGLSVSELNNALRGAGLPPEALTYDELIDARPPVWADRRELRELITDLKSRVSDVAHKSRGEQAAALLEKDRLWVRENLTAVICRYLNSGIPAILARTGINHSQVTVGYLRASDLMKDAAPKSATRQQRTATGRDSHSDVVAFLVSDDQGGPFELVYVDELVEELFQDADHLQVFVPLPSAVWVVGEMAERIGTAHVERTAIRRAERIQDWRGLRRAERKRAGAAIREFLDGLRDDTPDKYTIRTYVTAGTDFKRSAAERLAEDRNIVEAIWLSQLPRFVWVCEVIDRGLRTARKPSVVATIVLDATQMLQQPIDEKNPADDISPLFAHLPSHYFAPPFQFLYVETPDDVYPETAIEVDDEGSVKGTGRPKKVRKLNPDVEDADWFWRVTSISPYVTGRWSHEKLPDLTASNVASFSKGAVPQTTIT